MSKQLHLRIFAHSWISDWNHGNAHFLRGLTSEVMKRGHEVRCYEERNGWSMTNLAGEEKGAVGKALLSFRRAFPELDVRFYSQDGELKDFLARELSGADIVVIHEWNSPAMVSAMASTACLDAE